MKIAFGILFISVGYTVGLGVVLVTLTLIMAGIVGYLTADLLLDVGKPAPVQVLCRACGQPMPVGRIVRGQIVRQRLAYA